MTQRRRVALMVNGQARSAEVEDRTLLADLLRDGLGLTGTHLGCEHGVCGACTVLVDGEAVRSCLILAVSVDGSTVETIEGVAAAGTSPVPEAISRHHALQCGFCTPGFVMLAEAWIRRGPDRESAEEAVSANLCRCTGYAGLVRAFGDAAQEYDSSI